MTNSQFFSNCTADSIREAAAALKAGHLVAFPTETVYGLAADASCEEAIKKIYQLSHFFWFFKKGIFLNPFN